MTDNVDVATRLDSKVLTEVLALLALQQAATLHVVEILEVHRGPVTEIRLLLLLLLRRREVHDHLPLNSLHCSAVLLLPFHLLQTHRQHHLGKSPAWEYHLHA